MLCVNPRTAHLLAAYGVDPCDWCEGKCEYASIDGRGAECAHVSSTRPRHVQADAPLEKTLQSNGHPSLGRSSGELYLTIRPCGVGRERVKGDVPASRKQIKVPITLT